MLTTLPTLKLRLAINPADPQYDQILTAAAEAVSAGFDQETNRTLARTVGATEEFDAADTEIPVSCYPIESVTKFQTKSSEAEGWLDPPQQPQFIFRRSCIISLASPLSTLNPQLSTSRVIYTGGYVLPGTEPGPGQTPLPADLEQACIEQVAHWFQHRDQLGVKTSWPSGGTYQQLITLPLLPQVSAVLQRHTRLSL